MNDLISRSELIKQLRDAENNAFNGFYKGLVKAHKIVANMPSAQRWIPCSEKLPDETGTYLVTKRSNAYPVAEGVYIVGSACWTDTYAGKRYRDGYILAWMPLPEPYEVEE